MYQNVMNFYNLNIPVGYNFWLNWYRMENAYYTI
jgi:hypothetical protein